MDKNILLYTGKVLDKAGIVKNYSSELIDFHEKTLNAGERFSYSKDQPFAESILDRFQYSMESPEDIENDVLILFESDQKILAHYLCDKVVEFYSKLKIIPNIPPVWIKIVGSVLSKLPLYIFVGSIRSRINFINLAKFKLINLWNFELKKMHNEIKIYGENNYDNLRNDYCFALFKIKLMDFLDSEKKNTNTVETFEYKIMKSFLKSDRFREAFDNERNLLKTTSSKIHIN